MDEPITHKIDRAKAARQEIVDKLRILGDEAESDGKITDAEVAGIRRVRVKLAELDQRIKKMEVKRAAGEGMPDASGPDVSFSESDFWTSYRQSIINWLNDARDAVNVMSDLSGMDPKTAKVELKDALAVLFLFKQFEQVKAAYEILSTLQTAFEKAVQAASSGGQITIVDIRLKWRDALETAKGAINEDGFQKFINAYKAANKITGDKVDKKTFLVECVHFASRTMPDPKDIEKSFAKNIVSSISDGSIFGEDAEMIPADGKKAGYIILTVSGEAKYVGHPKEHEAVTWKSIKGSIDDASDGIKAAVGEAFKDTSVIDMPFRIALKLNVSYTNVSGIRRAEFFRSSDTGGSLSFDVRADEVSNSVGAPARSKKTAESMALLDAFLATKKLDAIKGTKVYK